MRPNGNIVPGMTPPSSASVFINWNGSKMMSGGGVFFPISSTMVPMPTVTMPTDLPVCFVNSAETTSASPS